MRHAIVVGANYGDEGKGLMTDFLAERLEARYVARFNGGAQAGHTVHRDGKRHVFSSYGAATLTGRQTILTKDVIVNPYAVLKEYEMLTAQGGTDQGPPPPLLVSRNSPVTTQFDMVVNQLSEHFRDDARYGSCGLGINETIVRHLESQRQSIAGSLFDPSDSLLHWIAKNWFPTRLIKLNLGMKMKEVEWLEQLHSAEARVAEFKELMARCKEGVMSFRPPVSHQQIVYEGAQGLALDEFMGKFPNVTRSNTGIANALDHIAQSGGEDVVGVYVTRTFLTRHGAGELKFEMPAHEVLGRDFEDETNKANEWQQNFRYAPLNIPETAKRIKADIERNMARIHDYGLRFVPLIAVTFADMGKTVLAVHDESVGPDTMLVTDLIQQLQEQSGIQVGFISYGRSAQDIEVTGTVKRFL